MSGRFGLGSWPLPCTDLALFGALTTLVLTRLRWFLAAGDARDAEILALRQQVLILRRQIDRARFTDADRTILATLSGVLVKRPGAVSCRGFALDIRVRV